MTLLLCIAWETRNALPALKTSWGGERFFVTYKALGSVLSTMKWQKGEKERENENGQKEPTKSGCERRMLVQRDGRCLKASKKEEWYRPLN